MIGEIAFGRMWETRIVRRGTPIARAARTKSFPFCPSTDPRKSRAKIGTFTTPIAIMIENRPGPSIAAIPIAISRPGIESMMSIRRMIDGVGRASEEAREGARGRSRSRRRR